MNKYLVKDIYSDKYYNKSNEGWYTWVHIKDDNLDTDDFLFEEDEANKIASLEGTHKMPVQVIKVFV